ncbi:MAG TPA: FGGY-family carbohydrate kinase, partial [Dermatophilaceae bacterium]|nr:FGGY-family carbohydrate kinase [Dermatophilaceae bacterium]
VGELSPTVLGELGVTRPPVLTAVGSHDTASAVVGVPAEDANFAYISCGTWGLVGVELATPVLTEASRAANFTNERGVDGTIRYLRNVMGLWVLSESLRTWNLRGLDVRLGDVLAQAAEVPSGGPQFDPDDPSFLPPGDMPARVEAALRASGQRLPQTVPAMVRCILDSLAIAFAAAVEQAAALSGRQVNVIHLVGGGSQNALLCQLVADASGREVVAGPVEATALGNLLVQARTHGALSGDLWGLRALLRSTGTTRTFRPTSGALAATAGGS